MRVLTAVLLGVVLFGMAGVARAQERADTDFYLCSDKCDRAFDACMRTRKGKGAEDCPSDVLKCRNKCSPQWREIKKQAAAPVSCRDKCQANFDACTRADDGKHGGLCARDVMVCRNACPPEAPPAAAVEAAPAPEPIAPPAAAPPPASADAAAPAPAVAPAPATAPAPAAAPHNAAPPPEKASAPAPAIDKRAAAPHPVPAERAAAAPAIAAVPENTLRQSGTASAGPQGTTRASEPKRSLWARAYCTMFYCGTGATAQKPVSCEDACVADYESCVAHADAKRGSSECSSGSLRCRQGCGARKGQ